MALWTPADIATAQWLDASDNATLTIDGGGVLEWRDKSGNNRHVAQSSPAARPTISTVNGVQCLAFNGTKGLTHTFALSTTTVSVFVVVSAQEQAGYRGIYASHGSAHGGQLSIFSSGATNNWGTYAASYLAASSTIKGAGLTLIQMNREGAHGQFFHMAQHDGNFSNSHGQNGHVGGDLGNSQGMAGSIGEVLVVKGTVSTAQREEIEGYLSHKWGLANLLPSGHPYKANPPGFPSGSTVSGVVMINNLPAARRVRAFSYNSVIHTTRGDEVTESLTLGKALSDPVDGSYSIGLHQGYAGDVFVIAFDDMGAPFTPSAALLVGDRVRPTTFAGYVFQCDGAGTLPAEEPVWNNDLENSHLYGTASLRAKPFYRPQVHGPIVPDVSGAVPWTPALITTALWLDAADQNTVVLSSGKVTDWNDKSGNNRAATQPTGSKQPTYDVAGFNGLPTLNFAGHQLEVAHHTDISAAGGVSVFIVYETQSTATNRGPLGRWSGPYDWLIWRANTGNATGVLRAGSANHYLNGGSPALDKYIQGMTIQPTDIMRYYVDGVQTGALVVASQPDAGATPLYIGSIAAGSGYITGNISEVIILNGVPTQAVRESIEGYLAHKWLLTSKLPADHPYKNDQPYS